MIELNYYPNKVYVFFVYISFDLEYFPHTFKFLYNINGGDIRIFFG